MKKNKLLKKSVLTLLFLLTSFTVVIAQNVISSAEITFEFVSKGVDGKISGFESDSYIDTNDISNSKFKGSVTVKSIKTGIFLRDWSLKGGKYFDEDTYPKILFESTSVEEQNNKVIVKGNLTIKGITKSVTINFTQNDNQLRGSATLYSSDFGINIKKQREDNEVVVTFRFDLE